MNSADFINWVEELYVHLEGVDGRTGFPAVPTEIRTENPSLTEENIIDCAERAHEKNDGLSKYDMDLEVRETELYAYLCRRLSNNMNSTAIGTSSGFDVFRRIVREEDPFHILPQVCVPEVRLPETRNNIGDHAPAECHGRETLRVQE